MTTLEKMRTEIARKFFEHGFGNTKVCYEVLQILDKYAEQEPTNTKLMLMEANINGYTEGLKDSSKAEQEPCDKCRYFDGNSCQHYDYKVGYTQGYKDASKRFRQEPCEDAVSRQAVIE